MRCGAELRRTALDFVTMGKSGLKVSAIGLGCNNFGWSISPEASKPVVAKALDLGITLFDTADIYGDPPGHAESVLGPLIKGKRNDIVLTSKFGYDLGGAGLNNSRDYILGALEASLKRLGTDWLDIYMIHVPDQKTPIEETLRAMDDIVKSGKARHIAVSNMETSAVVDALGVAKELGTKSFICSQNEYSLLERAPEQDLIPALLRNGLTLNPYFPLASGMLTGKYISGNEGRLKDNFLGLGGKFLNDRNHEIVRKLNDYAKARDRTITELALSWLVCQPVVAGVIAGATKAEQVEQNVKSAGWKLSAAEMAEINAIAT